MNLQEALAFYKTRHRSTGCIVTHLIGIPMLVLAPLMLIAGKRKEAGFLLSNGLIMQWMGHAIFEKNKPTLIETNDPMIIPASLVFVAEKWKDVLTGIPITEETETLIEPKEDDILEVQLNLD